ncbi:diguanylate cyclase [Candidatus Magnetomoraceae bacterium gMMP-15]
MKKNCEYSEDIIIKLKKENKLLKQEIIKIKKNREDTKNKKLYEEQLRLMASVFNNTHEGIIITNSDCIIQKVNPAFTEISGYSAEEVIGKKPNILKSNRTESDFYKEMWDTILKTGYWSGEIWNRKKDGEAYPEWLSITDIKNFNGKTKYYIALFHDITDLKHCEKDLKHQAYHDALTNLPNRQLFNDRLEKALAHAKRHKQSLAVIFLDLDKFKNINDTLGHNIGDILLQETAKRLKNCCRSEDTVARLGGDEFTFILEELKNGANDAVEIAQRIVTSFSEPFNIKEHEIICSTSIGVTVYPDDGEDAETLIKNADMAMYKAKDQGRNKYEIYTKSMKKAVLRQAVLENSLWRALKNKEFRIYYQPKVNIKTGLMTGMEALVRWQRDDYLLSPDKFIAFAENTGVIIPLGEWVLKTACQQAKTWHDTGYSLSVAVNLSVKQFQDQNLVSQIKNILKKTSLAPEYLNLEITENIFMQNKDRAIKIITELSEIGLRISIDDFGTGFSSLNCLKRFPLNELKIDRSFVKNIPNNSEDMAIAEAILSLAHSLNLKVVAEGVEKNEQLEFMNLHGCDEIQGYLFSKPLQAEEFTELLREGRKLPLNHNELYNWSFTNEEKSQGTYC